jgi:chromate reductase
MRVLAISGSLRAVSSNATVLRAMARLAPAGVEVWLYDGLATLPPFNPDLEDDAPASVTAWKREVGAADALLISSPEYAHGVPGQLKNALDWLVSGMEVYEKPGALINPSPASTHAQAQLAEILRTMSMRVIEAASIAVPLRSAKLDEDGIVAHPELASALRAAFEALVVRAP